tara:strand:- start:30038 stop:30463 length:426 start_codon:yes stop_codon:yes gene_type:complete
MKDYEDKVLLIVNVASKCGFTPQYKALQEMYENYHSKGLEILGFPCNQFGKQESGSNEEIKSFCDLNYGVSFKIFDKIKVNGKDANPLFKHLKKSAKGVLGSESIKWNFTKFVVDRNGEVVKRFAPKDNMKLVEDFIQSQL